MIDRLPIVWLTAFIILIAIIADSYDNAKGRSAEPGFVVSLTNRLEDFGDDLGWGGEATRDAQAEGRCRAISVQYPGDMLGQFVCCIRAVSVQYPRSIRAVSGGCPPPLGLLEREIRSSI